MFPVSEKPTRPRHLDNGQESIPALIADALTKDDIKYSYYREHTHALASGVPPEKIMAEQSPPATPGFCKCRRLRATIRDERVFAT